MDRTIECSLSQLEPELQEPLAIYLETDEQIITCYKTEWHMIWVQLITSKRVVILNAYFIRSIMAFRKPIIEKPKLKSIDLLDIKKAEIIKDLDYEIYKTQIINRDDQIAEACFITREKAEFFMNSLRYSIDRVRSTQNDQRHHHLLRMEELSEIHRAGLISDKEFEEKRKEILADL